MNTPTDSRKDSGAAFPRIDGLEPMADGRTCVVTTDGMTLRDYMAAKAMAAMIGTAGVPALGGLDGMEAYTAAAAYRIADAMLAGRSQP